MPVDTGEASTLSWFRKERMREFLFLIKNVEFKCDTLEEQQCLKRWLRWLYCVMRMYLGIKVNVLKPASRNLSFLKFFNYAKANRSIEIL